MVKTFSLTPLEAKRLSELLVIHQQAERDLKVGLTMLLAQFGIEEAAFNALAGDTLTIALPDEA